MSGLAVFALKMPSLLQFDQSLSEKRICHNLKTLYGVEKAPCDTYLRERLDEVSFHLLRKPFNRVFAALQRQKTIERFRYYEDYYLFSIDGTDCLKIV